MFKTQMVALNFLALSIGFTLGGVLFKDYYNARSPRDFLPGCWLLIGAVTCGILLVLTLALTYQRCRLIFLFKIMMYTGRLKKNQFDGLMFLLRFGKGGFPYF